MLIKSKQTLPLAVSAAAAALALALLCGLLVTTASARTGPRVGVGYATPVERSPLNRSVLRFQRVVTALATQILIDEVERERRAELAAARERRERFAELPGGVTMETLEAIAACESGGDPTAVSADGSYRGLYQFDQGTWESVGGKGDPAAATPAEQSFRAALLYSRAGSSPWPNCG